MIYDTIIIGAGPAGLSAGIYARRSGMNLLIIERFISGGQALNAHLIDNYPGISGVSGSDLMAAMEKQARDSGCAIISDNVNEFFLDDEIKRVKTGLETYEAKTVILAMGSQPRKLGLPDEDNLVGSGVSYCATCDGAFFKNREVAVIGGGDTAVMDAIYLSKIAAKVHIIHRRDQFRSAQSYVETLKRLQNVDIILDSVVEALEAPVNLEALQVRNVKTGGMTRLPVDGVFIAAGNQPQTELVAGQLELKDGYILAEKDCETSVAGVYAAGDIRYKSLRQIVTAASDGAIAATQAYKYVI